MPPKEWSGPAMLGAATAFSGFMVGAALSSGCWKMRSGYLCRTAAPIEFWLHTILIAFVVVVFASLTLYFIYRLLKYGTLESAAGAFVSSSKQKLELAKVYLDMGDKGLALQLLEEVSREGTDAERRETARLMSRHFPSRRPHS